MTSRDLLGAVLDTLLPGDGAEWPSAGRLGLAARTREIAALAPGGPEALDAVLAALPDDFSAGSQSVREGRLRAVEAAEPAAFERVVSAAYNAYYLDPSVRDAIERRTGYENRPPQPEGYELPPFDESLLDPVKARGPIWRRVPEE